MPNYELPKNVHLEKARSVVQPYMMSPTNLTVFMFCWPCTGWLPNCSQQICHI